MPRPTSFSDLILAGTSGKTRTYNYSYMLTESWAPGYFHWTSMWRANDIGGVGAVPPTSATVPTSTTVGALPYIDADTGDNYLLEASLWDDASGLSYGLAQFEDRLLHTSGLSGTVTTAQTVGGTLTRHTTGEGNEIWVEYYTNVGSTKTTITASYTNQDGTSGRAATGRFGGWPNEDGLCEPLTLQAGDTGVRSVESVTLDASTGTAGDFGVVIVHPFAMVTSVSSSSDHGELPIRLVSQLHDMPKMEAGCCLSVRMLSQRTNDCNIMGHYTTVEA